AKRNLTHGNGCRGFLFGLSAGFRRSQVHGIDGADQGADVTANAEPRPGQPGKRTIHFQAVDGASPNAVATPSTGRWIEQRYFSRHNHGSCVSGSKIGVSCAGVEGSSPGGQDSSPRMISTSSWIE